MSAKAASIKNGKEKVMDFELSLSSEFDPFIRVTLYAHVTFACAYWVFCCKRLVSGLILMTYEVKPNDRVALL